jgi:hypothetical protein
MEMGNKKQLLKMIFRGMRSSFANDRNKQREGGAENQVKK